MCCAYRRKNHFWRQALNKPEQTHGAAPVVRAQAPERVVVADGLLLEDATLEDIVKLLHPKGIEPTFRHLIPGK
ncbi:hypothetical protein ACFDR9_005504 [Janthinobacterium sp. CG_23.3]